MIDKRFTLALVALVGIGIGCLIPVDQVSRPVQATSSPTLDDLPRLDSSLAELQTLVAKLQPPASKQTDFEQVLDQCRCDDCECSSLSPRGVSKPTGASPGCPPVAEVAKTLDASPSTKHQAPSTRVASAPSTRVASAPITSVAYTPRWTHPSTIEDHMASDHGISTAGKSKAQLYAEHDAIHDQIGTVVRTSSSMRASTSTRSSCPGGVCPVPQRSYQTVRPFRLFRR